MDTTISADFVKKPDQTQLYRMPANSIVPVTAFGFTLAANYLVNKHLMFIGNYNFNQMNETKEFLAQDFISNFNTPKHKYNLGINIVKIKNVFALTRNFKWVSKTEFKEYSKYGLINAYYNLDLMVSYELTKQKIILKLGGTNVTNHRYAQAIGSPTVGAVYYFSILFDDMIR
jgi:outer membrane receptor for monomeric catechols